MEISKFEGSNLPGIMKIGYVLSSAVAYVSHPDTDNEVDVELKSANDWREIYFTPDTAKMETNSKEDDSGTYYITAIRFKVPKTQGDVIVKLDALKNREIVIKVTDQNDKRWLIGTPSQPARVSFSMSNDYTSLNSFQVEMNCISDTNPYLINDETVLEGAFSNGFSEGFAI